MGIFAVLPRIWCNSRRLGDRCEVKRRVWKDASAQEREARTAKHLALESFQAVDLSFHLAVAPGSLHSGQDRREVLLKTTAKRATGPIPECLAFFIQTNKDWPSPHRDRKSTRLNSSHLGISYAVFCLKKKKMTTTPPVLVAHVSTQFDMSDVIVVLISSLALA